MIKAVIFDFFGVVGLSTYAMMAEKYRFTPEQYDKSWDLHRVLDAGYITHDAFLQTYAEIIGISVQELVESYKEVDARMGINQPVLDLVDELRRAYKVGLLTNVSENAYHFVEPIVQYFDEVVASYQVRMAKPQIEIYELMAQKLGVDTSECIMIDDSESNCEGAQAAGMITICHKTAADTRTQLKRYLV